MEWSYLAPPTDDNPYRPRIPSLMPAKTITYANPYSSQKQSPSSKMEYVLTKAAPTLIEPCSECRLVTEQGISKFVSGATNRDCTIYCLRNPQLWLQRELKEDVTKVLGLVLQTISFALQKEDDGLPIENATRLLAKFISDYFTEDIKNINEYLKRPHMIQFVNNMKSGKYQNLKDIPGVVTPSWRGYEDGQLETDGQIVKLGMSVPGILRDRLYYFRRLPNNQIEVSSMFNLGGNAFKDDVILKFIVPLFRI